jgi:hypothetical protein
LRFTGASHAGIPYQEQKLGKLVEVRYSFWKIDYALSLKNVLANQKKETD